MNINFSVATPISDIEAVCARTRGCRYRQSLGDVMIHVMFALRLQIAVWMVGEQGR